MKLNLSGLLSGINELPGTILGGMLGPLPANGQLGLDPTQVDQARKQAINDMAMGLLAAPTRNHGMNLALAQGRARENYSGRMVDLLREQELLRVRQEREKEDDRQKRLNELAPEGQQDIWQALSSQTQEELVVRAANAKPEELPDKVQVALWLNNNDEEAARKWLMGQENEGAQLPEKWRLAMLATDGNQAEARKLVLQGFNGDNSTSVQQFILGKVARGESLSAGESKVWSQYMLRPDFMVELLKTLGGGSPAVPFNDLEKK
jgi:hypothetical protein